LILIELIVFFISYPWIWPRRWRREKQVFPVWF